MTAAALSAPSRPATSPIPSALPVMLVIDDEEGPRKSIRIVFHDQFRVLLATNGDEAMAIARAEPVDVAICDIRMAGASGVEVLKSLKQIDPAIEVIMLTAYETLDTARQALRLGACDYLSKPFDLSTIREAVARALHLRKISESMLSASDRLREITAKLDNVALNEEVSRTTTEIYAGVLHDINNPLTVIHGYVDMVGLRLRTVDELRGPELDKVRADLDYIGKQVSTCTSIASRYLRFVHQREFPGSYQPVNQTLQDLEVFMRTHPAASDGSLVIEPLPSDASVLVDATDLLQILLNLSINAFQSGRRDQTVRVTATRRDDRPPSMLDLPPETELTLGEATFAHQSPLLAITISDQGEGIHPDHLQRIFTPYFTTKAQSGTGLGLAIVSRLVQANRGLLHLKTRAGQGTDVTVYFPLKT